jgi:hypothetical protein
MKLPDTDIDASAILAQCAQIESSLFGEQFGMQPNSPPEASIVKFLVI